MMQRNIKHDRWLALGLLLITVLAAYLLFVYPWLTRPLGQVQDDIDQLRQRELHLRMQLLQLPQITQRLQQVRADVAKQEDFLPESSAELASVGLVERLERTVSAASPGNRGCTIANRSPMQPESRSRFIRVAVQVRLRCGTPELAEILYNLESSSPSLFVDGLNVMAQRYQLSQNESGNGLDVAFELAGYLRPGASTLAPVADPAASSPPGDADAG